jgi:type I restriction enzyme S subunit
VPRFALLAILSPYFQNQLLCRGTGSTAVGIKASKLPQLQILCPPIAEQRAILDSLHTACDPLDVAIDQARRESSLLREYRTRLIADVVTGKLDVREAAVNLPDELADSEPPDDLADDAAADVDESKAEPEEVEA